MEETADEINEPRIEKTGYISGAKDTELIILSNLNDEDLINACLTNKAINRACNDENFWRNRFIKNFEIQGKQNVGQYKKNNETWKDFYLKFVYYNSKYVGSNHVLRQACFKGDLSLVIYSYNIGKPSNNQTLVLASMSMNYEIMKILLQKGQKTDINSVFLWQSAHGKLETVKLLLENGANIHHQDDLALRFAGQNRHWDIVIYLIEHEANINANGAEILKRAIKNNNKDLFYYLLKLNINKNSIGEGAFGGETALQVAKRFNNEEFIRILSQP